MKCPFSVLTARGSLISVGVSYVLDYLASIPDSCTDFDRGHMGSFPRVRTVET
jgi:hypothetical protein